MAELTFYLIDNFESGSTSKWFPFGSIDVSAVANPLAKAKDLVAESCGSYMLKIKGSASDWYVGGIGTDLMIDASFYKRLQMDIYGSALGGKLRIELYDEDNGNNQIETDKNWQPLYDDKWAVEIPILGPGFTRISVPFTAFTLDNPGKGDGIWNPATKNGSSGLTRMQIVFVAKEKTGKVDVGLDNVLLTY
ncbi:hypothetical protein A2276_06505 [candidate division WOR-1 bacterium RIFOXYA12_FULL_43_27]|uniref:CBM11 domain-containing protein n=1 Tax=candidate division WOR-1 bacterium RIFOXYC2_FULL_46_14 TaxID=1802587 RepID=A0A1F4U597_UNCSA|nr:MAG: hypothetical protein A2276_06505 [candidate division WOR-1 bacterium RIFOXYA12_FULL_43_27]OGC20299.1 MAG: hypothetical protein A2292_04505 [candidate division WOR-1 bacterium RIFOXYB2_FULL_46_45]OGC31964.1 MAG: hypothetical protein A2232_06945 [candidate division WOR-1 bacterium RIFOXYA2_FULL_46_56]OGC40145.1 MAG: hypothetical protein A2438_02525 [candidate division WOR-1 bacterium RIFOXYC2_FULL_46_14]